ncbi:glucose-6-phosphate isomerase [Buchnera aphidicola (Taiwanaphis decaspermi)]|uniref:glucose-6-phosphate isomerase n=1 Tax=Buchnera aphidicola TaxID=9 RepID=UPI0031B86590
MKNINPTKTKTWKKLEKHFKKIKCENIYNLFCKDKDRFSNFSLNFDNKFFVDFSKNRINKKTIKLLLKLANEFSLKKSIKEMFCGKKINITENKSVLHTELRNKKNMFLNKKNVNSTINKTLIKIKSFSDKIINGKKKGFSNKKITDIVNIGIGGSNLGPLMVTKALHTYKNHLKIHYISNVDGNKISKILKKINFEKTIFLISSKTFSTDETIYNSNTFIKHFLKEKIKEKYIYEHFIAITSNIKKAKNFGILKKNIFEIPKEVGGRYSLWSAVGLSISLSIGFKNFENLLRGAHAMDMHFKNTPLKKNIPVILALISIWYNNFFNCETEAILSYEGSLYHIISYLQQAYMESNGKNYTRNLKKTKWQTGQIIWGGIGTNAQHAFFQLLHQGTKLIPCDFIICINEKHKFNMHHLKLLSNFLSQTKALAFGDNHVFEIKNKIKKKKFATFEGNKPSNSILIDHLNPYNLGILLSMYEHKIFTQGVIWNICSFDQWGVELGKNIAESIFSEIKKRKINNKHDSSTLGLFKLITKKKLKNN